jgi:hypothetical protein
MVPRPTAPRPVVPRLVVPRPFIPRPATPTPAAFGVELAVAVVEVAELDEEGEDEEIAVVPELFEELMTPELLTELQGTDVVVAAPTAPGIAPTTELVARFIPTPSNVGSAGITGLPAEQGARFAPPE